MAELNTLQSIALAIVTGVVPVLLWLWFWLKEDAKRPEPKGLLVLTFILGMLTVLIVFPLERLAFVFIQDSTLLIATWAIIEEIAKYSAFAILAMRTKFFDEPVDAIIYIITAALGFSAIENFLYTLNIINDGGALVAILNGNLRFLGATVLHTVSSAVIGISIALAFFSSARVKFISLMIGITTASVLHTYFNLFIIKTQDIRDLLIVFSFLWVLIIVILLAFEKVKKMKAPPTKPKATSA